MCCRRCPLSALTTVELAIAPEGGYLGSPYFVADFDSASGMVRALARFLHGKAFPALGHPRMVSPLVARANLLPWPLRRGVYEWGGAAESVPSPLLPHVRAERFARWVGHLYPRRPYQAVAVGSSNGAAIHLCAALGIPWLPQTFLVPVWRQGDADDPRAALEFGHKHARGLLESNPMLQLHHMHDPNQDRLMLRRLTYFRVKLRQLPPAYEDFVTKSLAPGGTILLIDCTRRWPTTRVGARHVFQHGALGGATEEEYLHGGSRVAAFLAAEGSSLRRWPAPTPDCHSPEAEWGFEADLAFDVERLARRCGYRVRRIRFGEPEDLSPLVADFYRWWHRRRGLEGDRLLVESFILIEPWWSLRTGAVPFWMEFNTERSATRLGRYLADVEPYRELYATLFSHGVASIGLAPISRWRGLLGQASLRGAFVGVDESAYPRDFATLVRYQSELPDTVPHRHPLPPPLLLREFEEFLASAAERYDVSSEVDEPKRGDFPVDAREPLSSSWSQVGGLLLHARVSTATPPSAAPEVVLVHGVGVSSRYMVPLAECLARSARVHAVDLPGFGQSEAPNRILDLPELADALADWLRVNGLNSAVVVANSFGCQVVVDLAARYHGLVDRLVLVGPTVDSAARSLPRQLWRFLRNTPKEPLSLGPVVVRDYLDCGIRRPAQTFLLALEDPVETKLPHIRLPVLVLRGDDDPIVPQRWADAMGSLLLDARVMALPNAAHTVNYNSPEALAELVLAFADQDQ